MDMNTHTAPEDLAELVDAIGAALSHRSTYGPDYSRGAVDALSDARRCTRPGRGSTEMVVVSLRRLVGVVSVLDWSDDDGSSIRIGEVEPALRPFLDWLAALDVVTVGPGGPDEPSVRVRYGPVR